MCMPVVNWFCKLLGVGEVCHTSLFGGGLAGPTLHISGLDGCWALWPIMAIAGCPFDCWPKTDPLWLVLAVDCHAYTVAGESHSCRYKTIPSSSPFLKMTLREIIYTCQALPCYRHLQNLSVCDRQHSPRPALLLSLFWGNSVESFDPVITS